MSTPPRRRRPAARRETNDGGGWLPTIAMGLGVVVVGLGIGVLVAVLTQRPSGKAAPQPVAALTNTSEPSNAPPTRRPIAIATFVAPRTPRPLPSPAGSPATESMRTAAAVPAPVPTMSSRSVAGLAPAPVASRPAPAAEPSKPATAAPVAVATPARMALSPVSPSPAMHSPSTAAPVASAQATAVPVAAPAPVTPPPSASTYDEHASAVVRRYVDALIRGDEKTAYSALGTGGGTLSEQAFLDPGARIVSLKVTRIDASNASVGCEIESAKGHYYATYHVTAATGGPYISEHDYIKV